VVAIRIFPCFRYVIFLAPAKGCGDAGAGRVFGGGPTTQAWLPKDGTATPLKLLYSLDARTLRCSPVPLTLVASHRGAGAREREKCVYRGNSLIRDSALLGPYRMTMHRAQWWVLGGGRFLMSKVPLYYGSKAVRVPEGLHLPQLTGVPRS